MNKKVKKLYQALEIQTDIDGYVESKKIERIEDVIKSLAAKSGYAVDYWEGKVYKAKE